MDDSIMANLLVNHTPFLSEQIKNIWIEYTAALTSFLGENGFTSL
jgi:hypothetical protein